MRNREWRFLIFFNVTAFLDRIIDYYNVVNMCAATQNPRIYNVDCITYFSVMLATL